MEDRKESASFLVANRESFDEEENLPHLLLTSVVILSHTLTHAHTMKENDEKLAITRIKNKEKLPLLACSTEKRRCRKKTPT